MCKITYIKNISSSFGISDDFFYDMLRKQIIPIGETPYDILSVPKNASKKAVSKAYRDAVKLYHPDRFVSMEGNFEIMEIVNQRASIINDANMSLATNN